MQILSKLNLSQIGDKIQESDFRSRHEFRRTWLTIVSEIISSKFECLVRIWPGAQRVSEND